MSVGIEQSDTECERFYEGIGRRTLFGAVRERTKEIQLFDSLGSATTQSMVLYPTGNVVMLPITNVYAALGEHLTLLPGPVAQPMTLISGFGMFTAGATIAPVGYEVQLPPEPPLANAHVEGKFNQLASEWKRATRHLSRLAAKASHPAYKEIIAMGEPVVPYILRDLASSGGYWSAALKAITHVDPSADRPNCSISEVGSAWLAWGRKNGKFP